MNGANVEQGILFFKKNINYLFLNFIYYLCNQISEEKFELIATSLKNAKAVITTPLGTTCNYFSSLKI